MKAKTKFLKMYNKLPQEARQELIFFNGKHPMSLYAMWIEVQADTKMGTKLLEDLGYKEDEEAGK